MKLQLLTGIVVLATAAGVAFAQDAKKEGKKGGKSVSVRMQAQNDSGETGSAKLTAEGADKTRVEISLKGAPKGTCAKLDPKPKHGLENVVDGKSTTVVPASLDSVKGMAINVHKSTSDIKTYVSCGDIGKGGGAMKKGEGKKSSMEKKS